MQDLTSLQVSSKYIHTIPKTIRLKDYLKEIGLNNSFIVIVNGRKAELNDVFEANTEITILPRIAGG